MTQLPGTTSNFSIGFRAFHINGVEDTGLNDGNSFMWRYDIGWQRGLNGATGVLGPAPSGGNNHTDVGENGVAVPSGSASFASRSEEQTSELQSLMRIPYAVFSLKKKKN